MVRAACLVLLALAVLATAKVGTPNFPVWPASYSTTIMSESQYGSTVTDVYVDATVPRYRYDVPSTGGTVTELVFPPPNPSVQPTIFFIITPNSCQKEMQMPPTPGPPSPPSPPVPPMNCTGFVYAGVTSAHNQSCDSWDMVCHRGTTVIVTTYLWFGQIPVRLASTNSASGSYSIDYWNFTAGVPPASLWDLPPQCSSVLPVPNEIREVRALAKTQMSLHESAMDLWKYDD